MNLSLFLVLVAIGLLTGAFSGLIGIGGGIILIPALVLFVGFSQHQAIGTSMAVLLPPIGFFAVYNYYQAGYVNFRFALILAVAFMVGSYFTSKLAVHMSENLLRKVFSILLVLIAVRMFFSK